MCRDTHASSCFPPTVHADRYLIECRRLLCRDSSLGLDLRDHFESPSQDRRPLRQRPFDCRCCLISENWICFQTVHLQVHPLASHLLGYDHQLLSDYGHPCQVQQDVSTCVSPTLPLCVGTDCSLRMHYRMADLRSGKSEAFLPLHTHAHTLDEFNVALRVRSIHFGRFVLPTQWRGSALSHGAREHWLAVCPRRRSLRWFALAWQPPTALTKSMSESDMANQRNKTWTPINVHNRNVPSRNMQFDLMT